MKPLPAPAKGEKFGRLVVTESLTRDRKGLRSSVLRCDCGTDGVVVTIPHLLSGHTTSCGCQQVDRAREANTTHGHNPRGRCSPELKAWRHMIGRCTDPSDKAFRWYGSRGVEVRYADFQSFLADVGQRPSRHHSIGRIDNDGHYEPGNCRWETAEQQQNNTRKNRYVEWQGQQVTVAEAARLSGLKPSTLHARLSKGYSLSEHLFARRLYLSKAGNLIVTAASDA